MSQHEAQISTSSLHLFNRARGGEPWAETQCDNGHVPQHSLAALLQPELWASPLPYFRLSDFSLLSVLLVYSSHLSLSGLSINGFFFYFAVEPHNMNALLYEFSP